MFFSFRLSMFKGTVKRDFGSPFFHYLNLPGPLTNGLKYIRFCLRFCGVIKILGLTKMTGRGVIPPGD